MRPRPSRRHRYSRRNAGQEAALRHIEQARAFSHEIGSTDDDVKRYFFGLSGSALDEIFSAYGKAYGTAAEQYAIVTFKKWKSGSTHMSGLVAQRLFNLLPPRMPASAKLELAGNIWRRFGPRSAHSFTLGPAADVTSLTEAVSDKLTKAIQNCQIPDQVRHRFEWLSSRDVRLKEQLLNYFLDMEKDLVICKLQEELPILQKQLQEYGDQTISVRTRLEIHRYSIDVWIDHRLEDSFREGIPDKTPVGSTAPGIAKSLASLRLRLGQPIEWLIVAALFLVIIFANLLDRS